ncbi:hypothetical protein H8K32_00105 [Undibacterium jejuense]|uniref:RiboL-PSP-HEPN domain-containing protein n=1 Tax=Undibacterium jejuense TaxID=1344949 RepID=A0A923KM28_9BURK|nr:hypothetical protein [Undibacterium jejuense]MBC3860488.1 hypothetical protein [Undibacterium jejuense]
MNINQILEHFFEKMTEISLHQRSVGESAKSECEKFNDYSKILSENENFRTTGFSSHNMFYKTAISGEFKFYGRRKLTIDKHKEYVVLHLNKQYQWLLAEAYENFENFLKLSYASAGMSDHNFWHASDFGDISLNQISEKNWEWYAARADKKKNSPKSILTQFRNKFSEELTSVEQTNTLGIDLNFSITLIEKLRHQIVHTSGVVKNRSDFLRDVFDTCGMYNNGHPKKENVDFIGQFFGENEYKDTILLLDHYSNHSDLTLSQSRFNLLTNILISYADLIAEKLKTHQANKNRAECIT